MSHCVARSLSPEVTRPLGGDPPRRLKRLVALTCACLGCIASFQAPAAVSIGSAQWDSRENRLTVSGTSTTRRSVTVVNAFNTSQELGTGSVNEGSWRVRRTGPSPVPCRVRATQSDGSSAERDVSNAPADCAPTGSAPPARPPGNEGDVSVNSTSQNSADVGVDPNAVGPVPEQPFVGNTNYKVLAINDLGMHCGDLDTRVASILPPFQVLLAQVIQMGGEPNLLNRTQAQVTYSAVSNPDDPILYKPDGTPNLEVFRGVAPDGSVYKTNFWDVASAAYGPFYPPGILDLFYDPNNPEANVDIGLPVPNVEELYIGADGVLDVNCDQPGAVCDGTLTAVQHAMPGLDGPYLANAPHVAEEFYNDKPFFTNFPFGYVAEDLNWFEGAGVPFAAFDDFGRENAYPLVRVQARVGNNVVATTDTVLPISGEASCKNCHSADVTDTPHAGSALPTNVATAFGTAGDATDPGDPLFGEVPENVSIEYATDINILRLHDQKHGTSLEANQPVVCQVCHYTPALDLAHVGPLGPENDPANANGRTQLTQSTMSNVMHSHHGSTELFPAIPAPVQAADGTITNQPDRLAALEQNCYQCHPGRNVQCLRGAMFNGDMLCSDCHGNLSQVGNDFSREVSPGNVGGFILGGNFYNPADPQPRVPWANEPGCGSCHTGDVRNNLAGTAGTVVNVRDQNDNLDGVRLRQAYRTGDDKATPIVPTNNRFAENIVPASFNGTPNPGAGNPKLYRVSTGHGGVMCEGCHGATHAEWPNANPFSNDNVTASQLQGHTGTIIECSTCHGNTNLGNTLNGPHGMHPVGETNFADGGHENLAETNPNACRACHGNNGQGSVLSRAAADRDFRGMEDGGIVLKGEPVTCTECHENEL